MGSKSVIFTALCNQASIQKFYGPWPSSLLQPATSRLRLQHHVYWKNILSGEKLLLYGYMLYDCFLITIGICPFYKGVWLIYESACVYIVILNGLGRSYRRLQVVCLFLKKNTRGSWYNVSERIIFHLTSCLRNWCYRRYLLFMNFRIKNIPTKIQEYKKQ